MYLTFINNMYVLGGIYTSEMRYARWISILYTDILISR